MIKAFPENEFVIYAINAESKDGKEFKYDLPDNMTEVIDVFFDTFADKNGRWGKRYGLSDAEITCLRHLLNGQDLDWDVLFGLITRLDSTIDFIRSKSFFDVLIDSYDANYARTSFVDYYWVVRNMVFPLFNIIKQPIPDADIYHCVSTGYAGVVGALCKHLTSKPLILTEHGIYAREREEEIIKSKWVQGCFQDIWISFFFNLSKCAYASADRTISLFEKNRELQVCLGCPDSNTHVISNGVSLTDYQHIRQERDDSGTINIGAIVRVVPIKDIKTMIYAFALVKEAIANAVFYIMGPTDEDFSYFRECVELVRFLGIDDVMFTERIDIKDYMGKMDLIVLTSISEGQPLSVLEAMACKKPVVSTDVGSCRELLYGNGDDFGDAGIVVPVMNHPRIAQAIIELCKNRNKRIEMGGNGYYRVSSMYGLENQIDSYCQLYDVLGGAPDGRNRI